MCGRFTLTVDPGELQSAFPGIAVPAGFSPRYNIAPSQPVAIIPNDGLNRLDYYSWGLIPSWAKDPSIGARMINARGETLAEKPSFRSAYRYHRCLIPADGFYEWKTLSDGKTKMPIYIHMQNKALFAFAGLWETWFSPDGSEIRSCTIITTEANNAIKPIHDRMPVIIPPENYHDWLKPGEADTKGLASLLKPYSPEAFAFDYVSRAVNNPANDSPECVRSTGSFVV